MTTVDDGADNAVAGALRWIDALPASAAEARALTGEFLAHYEPPVSSRTLGDILLVVSELVTNAIRHAGGVTAMRITAGDGLVEVTVRDASATAPSVRDHGSGGRGPDWLPGGYGWPLVRRLADVAVVPLPEGGKLIRATLAS
ncbi:hypothetical protein HY68_26795 [Streptomyces sp. AcH 505]|uniref:ATP-binding protein n=1 Tax=unclassified Streptomyces TaxID=2593676 RepID=UPI0005921042|nr:ATP-binding protein [Streptomyces sp. NBC_00370]KIF71378.1 hypothetical protein HY68_26795 [Streptomyces sp. AcH 505]